MRKDKYSNIMPRFIKPFTISVFALLLPLITSAAFWFEAFGPDYIFDTAILFINRLVIILVGVATLVFFWGVIQYVISQGDEKKLAEGRKYMLWGIIGLVVIASAWGIVNLIIYTIFGETSFSLPGFAQFDGGGGARGNDAINNALNTCPVCINGPTPTCQLCLEAASIGNLIDLF